MSSMSMFHARSSPFGAALVLVLALAGCTTPYSSSKELLSFSFTAAANSAVLSADVEGTIDQSAHTVALTVPHGTDATALRANFSVSAEATVAVGGVAQVSGTSANSFSSPVSYTITAADKSTVVYVVTVTQAEVVLNLTSGAAADVVVGQSDFTSTVYTVSAVNFHQPFGNVAVAEGKLFVSDTYNMRIAVFDPVPTTNGASATFALGVPDLVTVGGGTSQSTMMQTRGVATNGTQFAVVDTYNNRLLFYNSVPTSGSALPDVVLGQQNWSNSWSNLDASSFYYPISASLTATKLLVADFKNNRVLVWNSLPTTNGQPADLVLGQADLTTSNFGGASTELFHPSAVWSDGTRVAVADENNNRVLIWNTFPTTNGQAADLVLGRTDFAVPSSGSVDASSMTDPMAVACNGTQFAVADAMRHRVMVWKTFPTSNNQPADLVVGQTDFTGVGSGSTATTLYYPEGLYMDATRLFVSDAMNQRVLIFGL